jgi:hypothetical protein
MNENKATKLSKYALMAATVGSLIVLVLPAVEATGISPPSLAPGPGMPTTSGLPPLIDEHLVWFGALRDMGPVVFIYLAIPLIICLAGLLVLKISDKASRGVAIWSLGIIFLLLSVAGLFSIGLFYLPSVVLLINAAIADFRGSKQSRAIETEQVINTH